MVSQNTIGKMRQINESIASHDVLRPFKKSSDDVQTLLIYANGGHRLA
jgi:hypothetical protein